jgi:diguanylate cyclase (GGDEF)-like protein
MHALPDEHRGPGWWPLSRIADLAHGPDFREVVLVWLVAVVLAVLTAALEARLDWSAIPIQLGFATIPVSIYPPVAITLLLTLWMGPAWGALPAWIATTTSALLAGVPLPSAVLFGLATPIELVIVWGAMVVLNAHPDLETGSDVAKYLVAGVIAATASSLAGLIWITARQLDMLSAQGVWRGWIVGDVVQMLALIPVLRHTGHSARSWIDRRAGIPPRHAFRFPSAALLVAIVVTLLAVLVFEGVRLTVHALDLDPDTLTASGQALMPRLRELALFLGLLFVVSALTTTTFAAALARMAERERGAAQRDPLTGCFNRRAFVTLFEREAERSKRLGRGLSLVYFDIDHFKRVNDTHGHDVGDEMLKHLVLVTDAESREHDVLFRWGGEEFVLLLPHTPPGEAVALAERLRQRFALTPLARPSGVAIGATISLGVAGATTFPASSETMIAAADAACYRAKRKGRNRVEDATEPPEPAPAEPPLLEPA